MKKELIRAFTNPWNVLIIIIIVTLMFANAYFSGWKTGLNALNSQDILDYKDRLFYAYYYGNTFKVWFDSYSTVNILVPFLLVIPYIISYRDEKKSNFRYFIFAREGKGRYLINKLLAIVISGLFIVISAELIFYTISFFLTYPVTGKEFLENTVSYDIDFFLKFPYLYFLKIQLLRVTYYFALVVFSVGITSKLDSKTSILLTPFLVITLLDSVLPQQFAPYTMIRPYSYSNFSLIRFIAIISLYIIIGVLSLYLNEKKLSVSG